MNDLIDRQAAIDECNKRGAEHIGYAIAHLPSAQPKPCEDAVSRKAVYEAMVEKGQHSRRYKLGEIWELNGDEIREALDTVPSAQPERTDCTYCPEYDTERHFCPRYCKTIRKTLEEVQPERKTGKWIVVDDGCISGKCSVCGWEAHMYEDDVVGMDYCPNCGARLEGEG